MAAEKNTNAIRQWLNDPLGKHLILTEKQAIDKIEVKMTGSRMLLLGPAELSAASVDIQIGHKLLVNHEELAGTNLQFTAKDVQFLCARDDKLAIESDSMDVVYLAHALEIASNPHEVLREAYRVLRPEGYLIITGFNPYSLWGVLRLLLRFTSKFPWTANFMSSMKIKDWLSLLGLDLVSGHSYCYTPPLASESCLAKFFVVERICNRLKLPFGAANVIVACKRVVTLTPLRPVWHDRRMAISGSSAAPVP